jgi:preprotein translocase subunit Sec63
MNIRSSDSAFLYLLFSLQVIGLIYGWLHILWTLCSAERRANSSKKGIMLKLAVCILVTKWAVTTVDLVQQDADLSSEYNPYKLLHIDDDGSFNTKEIRDAYRRLSKKYHPDKVDKKKF